MASNQSIVKVLIIQCGEPQNILSQQLREKPEILIVGNVTLSELQSTAKITRPEVVLAELHNATAQDVCAVAGAMVDYPSLPLVFISDTKDPDLLRAALRLGAKDYLFNPVSVEELYFTLIEARKKGQTKNASEPSAPQKNKQGKVLSFFSSKGGLGKTTIVVNMAVCMAKMGFTVTVVDLDLQFGGISILLDMVPASTIVDASRALDQVGSCVIEDLAENYSRISGPGKLRVMSAPGRPEQVELVKDTHMMKILEAVKNCSDYVLIDTPLGFGDATLAALDASDEVVMVASLDIPTIRNLRVSLEVMDSLNYRRDNIKLLVNRSDVKTGIAIKELETNLGQRVWGEIPSDGRVVVPSANSGVPFVITTPGSKASMAISRLCTKITGRKPTLVLEGSKGTLSGVQRMFKGRKQ